MTPGSIDGLSTQALGFLPLSNRHKWLLLATFAIAYVLAVFMAIHVNQSHAENRRFAAKLLAQGYAQRIQERLHTALVSTYVLASVVKTSGGQVRNFNDVAAELMTLFPSVSALQLAPDGVIQEIYPLTGNEAAIGHDLLADRKRNREAAAAITTQQLTLAGPFNLIQGGMGTVGRLPIFLTNERGESHFWGFAIALIRIPNLVGSAGLGELVNGGYRYELWHNHPETEQRHVFASSGGRAPVAPVEYVITVFGGRWILAIAPEDGWMTAADYVEIFGYSLVVALIVTLLQFFAIRSLRTVQA